MDAGIKSRLRQHPRWGVLYRRLFHLYHRLRGVTLHDLSPGQWTRRWRDWRFDLTHGVRTAGVTEPAFLDATPVAGDGSRYQAIDPRLFVRIVEALPVPAEERVFVDLGAGKGRALLLAAQHPFRRLVGVEFSPELCRIAQANVAGRQGRPPIELLCQDAALFEPPLEDLLIYMYNPFGEATMERVLTRLQESLRQHPRAMELVYVHPGRRGFFQRPGVRLLKDQGEFAIYQLETGLADGEP